MKRCGVAKYQVGQVERRAGAESGPAVFVASEQRQTTGVIKVRMGQHHRVEPAERPFLGQPVEILDFFRTLEEAAVHHDVRGLRLHHLGGSGHFAAGGAEEGDAHPAILDLGRGFQERVVTEESSVDGESRARALASGALDSVRAELMPAPLRSRLRSSRKSPAPSIHTRANRRRAGRDGESCGCSSRTAR